MLYLELAVVTVLIVINGLLSMSELAIVSSRPARLAGLVELGLSQGMSDAIGVGLVVGIITYAALIVGELVPQQIALRDPEIQSEHGLAERAYVKRDDGSYLISGWLPTLEFADLLGIALPPSRPYQTCAGFLLQEFAAIPGDGITVGDWRFEIVDMDGRRIDKVLATRLEAM